MNADNLNFINENDNSIKISTANKKVIVFSLSNAVFFKLDGFIKTRAKYQLCQRSIQMKLHFPRKKAETQFANDKMIKLNCKLFVDIETVMLPNK